MGVGEIYKEKKKREEIHVEEQKFEQQGNINKQRNEQSNQNVEENVLKSYTDSVSDTSQIQNQPKMDLTAVVTASNIHANASAQKVLNGEELSQERQEKLQEDEQKIKEGAAREEKRNIIRSELLNYISRYERAEWQAKYSPEKKEYKEEALKLREQVEFLLRKNDMTLEECKEYENEQIRKEGQVKKAQMEFLQKLSDEKLLSEKKIEEWRNEEVNDFAFQKSCVKFAEDFKRVVEEQSTKQYWLDKLEEKKKELASHSPEEIQAWREKHKKHLKFMKDPKEAAEAEIAKIEKKLQIFGDAEKLEGELADQVRERFFRSEDVRYHELRLMYVAKANALNLEDMTSEAVERREKEFKEEQERKDKLKEEVSQELEQQLKDEEERKIREEALEQEILRRKEEERQKEERDRQIELQRKQKEKEENEWKQQWELEHWRKQKEEEEANRKAELARENPELKFVESKEKFYVKFDQLMQNFAQKEDYSSERYMDVYRKLSHLSYMRKNSSVKEKADAYMDCYKAAVRYYNDHRGHRWSAAGKRRKEKVNELISVLQQTLGSEILRVDVSDMVIGRMLSDTSDTGFTSKKSREFFREKARMQAGGENADEYSYKMAYYKRADYQRYKQMSSDFGMDPMQEVNLLSFDMAQNYKVNLVGLPLTERDAEIKKNTESFLKAVNGTQEQKQELFQKYAAEFIKLETTPEMMTPEYVLDHWEQMRRISSESQWLVKAFSHMDAEKQTLTHDFMHTLSEKDQQELNNRLKLFENLPELMDALAEAKNVQDDVYVEKIKYQKAVNGTQKQKQKLFQKMANKLLQTIVTDYMLEEPKRKRDQDGIAGDIEGYLFDYDKEWQISMVQENWEKLNRILTDSQRLMNDFSHIDPETKERVWDYMDLLSEKDQEKLKERIETYTTKIPKLLDGDYVSPPKDLMGHFYVAGEIQKPLSSVRSSARVKAALKKK